jgi:hypothetical protein
LLRESFCLTVLVVAEGRGFLTGLNVRTAFLREAATAGTNAHTTSGENIKRFQSTSFVSRISCNIG